MKNKIISILLCFILISVVIPSVSTSEFLINREINNLKNNSLNGGLIKEEDGVIILELNGSYYDI